MSFRPITRALILAMLAGVMVLAGCGVSPATGATVPNATPTPSPTPSPTPLPTVDPTLLAQKCGRYFTAGAIAHSVGGLAVARQTIFGNLAYPGQKLPDNLPLKPYQIPAPNGQADPSSIPVNPLLNEGSGGYVIVVCNPSSVPHAVQRIDARIEVITPVSGTPNYAPRCMGGPYTRQSGAFNGGCGGGDPQDEYMHADFAPSAGVGTTVTATQKGNGDSYGPLPVTLQPGQGMTIEVGMASFSNPTNIFTMPGYYTFTFGVGVDGAAPIFAVTSPATLLDSAARQWSGGSCLTPAMQAQIPPATDPPTSYLCPGL